MNNVLVLSNMEIGDVIFDSDAGSWNVTRANRNCEQGAHELYKFSVTDVFDATMNVEVDLEKVAAMKEDRTRLLNSPPLIMAMENGRVWLIDGHHRLRAMYELGMKDVAAFVIEDGEGEGYKVYYNGQRVAPWLIEKE